MPLTFAERRSVLQVLEQYGPIETFKMAPDLYANFVSVTQKAATASQLVASSPLVYHIPIPRIDTNVLLADLEDTQGIRRFDRQQPSVTTPPAESAATERAFSSPDESAPPQGQKQFKLHIYPAPDYSHKFAMSNSPLQESWPGAYLKDKSFMAAALKQSLPRNMPSKGLAHWLVNMGNNYSCKSDRLQLKSWLPSKMKESKRTDG
ncbi:hypothetical protein UVI_02049960 [Ustilaginoidea virens]|nr:hypothetical protein UVI_02049960 [Ustilaginoidea virens]